MDNLDASFDKAFDEASQGQSKDQAPPEPTKEAEAAVSATTTEEKQPEPAQSLEGSEELLPLEEYERLRKDPEALRKALNKAFTQKTQQLAEQRKALEPFQDLVKGLQEDPQGTIRALAENLGIKIEQAETKKEVKDATGELVAELKQNLGPDLEFLADKLAPALERITQRIAEQTVSQKIEPLEKQTKEMREETVRQQIDANLELFTKKHPGWEKHESEMTKIGARFQPVATGKDAPSWMEYMEILYNLATRDGRDGDIAKKTVERMTESAKKSETSEGGVSGSKVTKAAPKGKSFDEAFDESWRDAQAGVIYD